MSDSLGGASDPAAAPSTAGALLRQARQARGLHIAALAASIKVTPHKLELLETDRFDELPGATFTRALAQTVCRSLKIDAAPVMALLPQAPGLGLEQMSRGLNQPFRERPGRRDPDELQFLKNPVLIGAIALGALALAVYLLPSGWLASRFDRPVDKSGDSRSVPATEAAQPGTGPAAEAELPSSVAAPGEAVKPGATAETVFPGEPSPDAASAPAAAASVAPVAPAVGALQLRVSARSWVSVLDRRGVSLLSRMVQPGETVALEGATPLRVKIGNAAATQLTYKGESIDLAPVTSRDNVAKLELR